MKNNYLLDSNSPKPSSSNSSKKHKLIDRKILRLNNVSYNRRILFNLALKKIKSSRSLMKTALLNCTIKNNAKNHNFDKRKENFINKDNTDTIMPKLELLINQINMKEKAGSSKKLVNDTNSNVNKQSGTINMKESIDYSKKNIGPKNDSDSSSLSSFVCDLECNVNFNKNTNQPQDMEETLKIKENFENVLKSSSARVPKEWKYKSYNRKSLDITSASVSKENENDNDNDNDNDEIIRNESIIDFGRRLLSKRSGPVEIEIRVDYLKENFGPEM